MLVEMHRHTSAGSELLLSETRAISAGGSVGITPNAPNNTFMPGEHIEVSVYRNAVRQHLLTRHMIKPHEVTVN